MATIFAEDEVITRLPHNCRMYAEVFSPSKDEFRHYCLKGEEPVICAYVTEIYDASNTSKCKDYAGAKTSEKLAANAAIARMRGTRTNETRKGEARLAGIELKRRKAKKEETDSNESS
jgi:hypothetical protein